MLDTMGSIEEQCNLLWGNGALKSEPAYRRVMLGLIGEAHHRALRLDFRSVERLQTLIEWTRPYCRCEPLASAYDLAQCLMGITSAETLCNLQRWRQVYRAVASIRHILREGDARRKAAGVPARRNSETRWCILRILGDCKWQDEGESRDRLMTPEQIIAAFYTIDGDVRPQLDGYLPDSPGRYARLVNSLAWTNFTIIKMAARYNALRLPRLIVHFNKNNGSRLAVTPGHFRSNDPPEGGSHWYWDFELTKLYLADDLQAADYDYITRQWALARSRAEMNDHELWRAGHFLTHAAILRQARHRLEVLSG